MTLPPESRLPRLLIALWMQRDPLGFFLRCQQRHGDVFVLTFGTGLPRNAWVCHPALAAAFIDWLSVLKRDLAIPATLSAYQAKRRVTRGDIPALVEIAINDTCHQTNPRPCTREDFERIFAEAM